MSLQVFSTQQHTSKYTLHHFNYGVQLYCQRRWTNQLVFTAVNASCCSRFHDAVQQMLSRSARWMPPQMRLESHLESICLEIHSIKGNKVAGLLHRPQIQEGILGLGTSSGRAPVIERAGSDCRALLLCVCCHCIGVGHDGVKEGDELALSGVKGNVAHIQSLGCLACFVCCCLCTKQLQASVVGWR